MSFFKDIWNFSLDVRGVPRFFIGVEEGLGHVILEVVGVILLAVVELFTEILGAGLKAAAVVLLGESLGEKANGGEGGLVSHAGSVAVSPIASATFGHVFEAFGKGFFRDRDSGIAGGIEGDDLAAGNG